MLTGRFFYPRSIHHAGGIDKDIWVHPAHGDNRSNVVSLLSLSVDSPRWTTNPVGTYQPVLLALYSPNLKSEIWCWSTSGRMVCGGMLYEALGASKCWSTERRTSKLIIKVTGYGELAMATNEESLHLLALRGSSQGEKAFPGTWHFTYESWHGSNRQ